jgi:hypothetical protein
MLLKPISVEFEDLEREKNTQPQIIPMSQSSVEGNDAADHL